MFKISTHNNPTIPKEFFNKKFNFLKSLTKNSKQKIDFFEDSEFKPIQENLIGEGKTEIASNENRNEVVGELAEKEVKRLEKLKAYRFERIIYILKSPLIPVIFRTIHPKGQTHFCQIPRKDLLKISPIEANQGTLSNCYFISSLSSMANYPELLTRLFLKVDPALGIYSISLCKDGMFEEFVIDDYFPCSLSKSQKSKNILKMRMCHPYNDLTGFDNKENIPIWSALIEKVYSKIFKGFWNIGGGGGSVRAFKDLTGAPVSFHFFDEIKPDEAWELLRLSKKEGWPMSAPTHQNSDKLNFMGLVLNNWHSYSVLDIFEFDDEGKRKRFVKIRDPWGNVKWPDSVKERKEVKSWVKKFKSWTNKAQKLEEKVTGKEADFDEGTLYITLEDFLLNFSEVSICRYNKEYILSQKRVYFESKKSIKENEKNDDNFLDFVSTYENSICNYVFSKRAKVFQIIVKKPGKYYIMFSQRDKRHKEIKDHHYIIMNLLKPELYKEKKFENLAKFSNCKYLNGISSNIRDPFIEVELGTQGCYLLYLKVPESYASTSKYGTISTYGPEACLIFPVASKNIEDGNILGNFRKEKFENLEKIILLNQWLFQGLKDKALQEFRFEESERNSYESYKPRFSLQTKGWHSFDGNFKQVYYCLNGATGGFGSAMFYNGIDASSQKKSAVKIRLWLRGSNISISKIRVKFFFSLS